MEVDWWQIIADAKLDLTKLVPEVHLVAINSERDRDASRSICQLSTLVLASCVCLFLLFIVL